MIHQRLKRYQREEAHSYAFGFAPTLELLRHRPGIAEQVLLKPEAETSPVSAEIRDLVRKHNIPVIEDSRAIDRISQKENAFAAAVFRKEAPPVEREGLAVALWQPRDMGNLGTILRTMLGFGVSDLILFGPAADLWDPKVARASMGALFRCRVSSETCEPSEALPFLRRTREDAVLAFAGSARQTLRDAAPIAPPATLLFGNEGAGLPEELLTACEAVHIPQSDAIDSLNLAISVAIGLYEATRP